MLKGKVLLTRPVWAMPETVACVKAAGFSVFEEPLLTIVPTGAARPSVFGAPVVMATSGAALRVLSAKDVCGLEDRPCFCVGEGTAAHARALGFRAVIAGNEDGRALAERIARAVSKTTPIVHIGALRPDPRARLMLAAHGLKVVLWPVYEAVPASELSLGLREALGAGEIGAALFFSSRTGHTFLSGVARAGLARACRSVLAVALSRQVADVLRKASWHKLVVARKPSLREGIACLRAANSERDMNDE